VLQQVKPNHRAGQLDVAWHIAGAPTVVLPPLLVLHLPLLQGLPRVVQMREFLIVAVTLFTRTIFGMAAYFR
jgi:hypothetical protein